LLYYLITGTEVQILTQKAVVDSLLRFVGDPEDAALLLLTFPLQGAAISKYEALRHTGMRP
jgi:hypothetical protein